MRKRIPPRGADGVDQALIASNRRLTPAGRLRHSAQAAAWSVRWGNIGRRHRGQAPVPEEPKLDPLAIFGVLADCEVRYVLIGGVAMQLHGSAHVTTDVDICVDQQDQLNLRALVRALRALGAQPADWLDPRRLTNVDVLAFETSAGRLDLTRTPDGTSGYADLAQGAEVVDADGVPVHVASLADLVRMKRAADRVQDRLHLLELEAMLDASEGGAG
jgi:hypothetical protein